MEKDQQRVTILNIKIDSTSIPEVLRKVEETIKKNEKIFIATPNPEIVLQAHSDSKLKEALNASDIAIPDGVGILKAESYLRGSPSTLKAISIFYGTTKPQSKLKLIKGRELFAELIKLAHSHEWKVVLLGDNKGSAQAAVKILGKTYTKIKLYPLEGPNLNIQGNTVTAEDKRKEKYTIDTIHEIKPQLLFAGFGAPKQEKWIYKWQASLKSNINMVVGGTFDYISEKVPLPPHWWPNSLEWLWRLLTKPGHWKRVWNAVVVFPYKIWNSKV